MTGHESSQLRPPITQLEQKYLRARGAEAAAPRDRGIIDRSERTIRTLRARINRIQRRAEPPFPAKYNARVEDRAARAGVVHGWCARHEVVDQHLAHRRRRGRERAVFDTLAEQLAVELQRRAR